MNSASFLEVYLIFNIFLFFFALYIFFKLTGDLMKKSGFFSFRVFILAFECYLIFNSLWTLQEFDVIQFPRALFTAVCFLSLTSVVFNALCFFVFTMVHFDIPIFKNVRTTAISLLPFFTALVLLVVSLWNGMVFSVSEENNIINGPVYIALPISSFLYFLVIAAVSIHKAVRLRSRYARIEALELTGCVIFLSVWALLDDKFDRVTIIPVAIFAVILFIFISIQQSNVYTDALTKLNNRRKSEEFLSAQFVSLTDRNPVYLFLCDVNDFKLINDKFGHPEGDSALILVSDALKQVISGHAGFVARYGGDEFICAWRPSKENDTHPETLIREIDFFLRTLCKDQNKPYVLSVSVGYVRCTDSKKTVGSYVKEADEMLYENKKAYHEHND